MEELEKLKELEEIRKQAQSKMERIQTLKIEEKK